MVGINITGDWYYPTLTTTTGWSSSMGEVNYSTTAFEKSWSSYFSSGTAVYQMLFGETETTGSLEYWMPKRGIATAMGSVSFQVGYMNGIKMQYRGLASARVVALPNLTEEERYPHGGTDNGVAQSVRPIVYLKTTLKTNGQNADGAWTFIND